jgi:hypothetical protein
MDPRPTVAGVEPAAKAVLVEQAIFTSVRSPWGRGYRLIAASPGVRPDEKGEIVQRAPSHQSICDASPHGRGLASFAMQSGRRCIFLAQNAGMEHSARGDYRVHTHVVLLEPATYRGLRCDPLAVESAARAALGDTWLNDQPPASLPLLPLDGQATSLRTDGPPSPDAGTMDGLLAVLSCLLRGRRVLVQGPPDPAHVVAWIWSGLPAGARDGLSLSCGLRLSPGRSFSLILMNGPHSERQRSGLSPEVAVIEWGAADRLPASEFDPWLRFVRRRWEARQLAELDHLSAALAATATATSLSCVAALSDDVARLGSADLALVDELTARHAGREWPEGAGRHLYVEFRRVAALRRQQLEQPPAESGDTGPDAGARTG